MRRTRSHEIQTLFEGRVLFHLDGFTGAGKTTTMQRLQREFPDVVFKDIDDFIEETPLTGLSKTSPTYYKDFNTRVQQYVNTWIDQQPGDIVLVGVSYFPPGMFEPVVHDITIPTTQKYIVK